MIYDIIIIGAGPAGMTASIYAKRAGMNLVMLEKGAPGGQMVNTFEIENYPGFDKIGGPELAMKMFEHTQAQGVKYEYGNIINIDKKDNIFELTLEDNNILKSKAIIVASGTTNNKLGIKNEDKFSSKGISWCAICDGSFYKDQEVAVIGGGNSALEESLYLANIVSKVYIIHRRDEFRADDTIQKRVLDNDKIEILYNYVPEEFIGDSELTGVKIKSTTSDDTKEIKVKGVFEYVGQSAITSMLNNFDVCDDRGYIIVNNMMETKVPGLYAAGDVCKKEFRQIATAISDGALAGQEASKYVKK